jgi:hypothetical protein
MSISDTVRNHITDLIERSKRLMVGDGKYGLVRSSEQSQECSGWMASALNIVQLICPNPENAYRKRAERIAEKERSASINSSVGEFGFLLIDLLKDFDNGLLASVADRARAETFDNFLDHAKEYMKANQKNEAGVIAGVVFEDSLRRVCRKNGIEEKDEKLDNLISELSKKDIISQAKAKRARAAAHVRTKATHAQWDEFDMNDVKGAVDFTEEFILMSLDT